MNELTPEERNQLQQIADAWNNASPQEKWDAFNSVSEAITGESSPIIEAPADFVAVASKPDNKPADMLVREIGQTGLSIGRCIFIYPFLKPDAPDTEIQASGFIAVYPDSGWEYAVNLNGFEGDEDMYMLSVNDTRRLSAALQYALSTLE